MKVVHTLSLGAGVQSTTMALMFARGALKPMPDAAIFADTGAEPEAVYKQVEWLEQHLPYPVYTMMWNKGLKENILSAVNCENIKSFASVPFYTTPNGMLKRQCTREYKIQPIEFLQRYLMGVKRGQRVPKDSRCYIYIGISTDEAHRMRNGRAKWQVNEYPLIEKRMSRNDCLAWLAYHDYPRPPKSSCVFCPYHSDQEWKALSAKDMVEAVKVDRLIRNNWGKTSEKLYLHRSRQPLEDVNFAKDGPGSTVDMFGEECEGLCGV